MASKSLTERRLYSKWNCMVNRCHSKKIVLQRYAGRGIQVCDEWRSSFESFKKWAIENGYREGLQLDRINNDGNYAPDNCRFVTPRVNSNNRSNNVRLTYQDNSMTLSEFSRVAGIKYDAVQRWHKQGLTPEQMIERAELNGLHANYKI